MSFENFKGLNAVDFHIMYEAMEQIEAQKVLTDFQIADYPNLKESPRRELKEAYKKQAFPTIQDPILKMDQMAKQMGMV